jgi:hypothetical protein
VALIDLRDRFGVQTFEVLMHYPGVGTPPPEIGHISAHDEIANQLTPDPCSTITVTILVRGRRIHFEEGRMRSSSTEPAEDFVREAGAILPGPHQWIIYIPDAGLGRALEFMRRAGLQETEDGPVRVVLLRHLGSDAELLITTDHEVEFIRLAHLWDRR